MSKFLLILHVLAAIVAIGPVTVAASMFPPTARQALSNPEDMRAVASLGQLHRICSAYAVVGAAVPVLGIGTASSMHVLGTAWLNVSIGLTVVAAIVLGGLVLPWQTAIVGALAAHGRPGAGPLPDIRATARLAMATGIFNLLWAAVTVLMIVRPGSTTSA